jgi:hypothetical protein
LALSNSTFNHTSGLDGSSIRKTSNRNVFKTASQAIGSVSLAVLTQHSRRIQYLLSSPLSQSGFQSPLTSASCCVNTARLTEPIACDAVWEDKKTELRGCYIGANSTFNHTSGLDGSSIRKTSNRNVFKTASQAIGSVSLAVLTQQLADVNGDWKSRRGYQVSLQTQY